MAIKCSNCEHEFEKGKFCPECGAKVKAPKENEDRRKLDEIHSVTTKLGERLSKLEEKEKEKASKESKETETEEEEENDRRSFLDFF